VCGSISAKIGVAPTRVTALAVAKNRQDHLVAGADVEGHECQEQGIAARRAGDRMRHVEHPGQFRLEVGHVGSQHELAGVADAGDRRLDLAPEHRVLAVEREQGNRRQEVGCRGLAAGRGGGGRGGLRAVRRGHARLQLLKSCGRSSHPADGGRALEDRDRHDRAGRSTRIERGGRNACVELRGAAADAGGGE
jgi:hypothetical protein